MSTLYISPTGSGDKSGSSWANAAAIGSLDAVMKKAGAGGTVLLAADQGAYHLTKPITITASGVTVSGANADGSAANAVFEGTRTVDWKVGAATGNDQFRIAKGASNLTFEHMNINNTGTAFKVVGDVSNLTIQHMGANNVQRFVEDYASGDNKTATITGLTIRDIDVVGYSKQAIRLQYNTSKVLIEDVRADSHFQTGDEFAMGVHLEDTVHDVTFRRVTVENNATVDGGKSDYWQGDGFSAERGTYNILFQETVARGNTDAGYDIKSSNVTFDHAVSENNGRNYRIWGSNVTISDSVGLDPHKRGGITTQTQLWVNDGATNVKVVNSNFTDSGSGTKALVSSGGVTFVNTTITVADDALAIVGAKPAGYVAATVTKVAATGSYSTGSTYADGTKVLEALLPVAVSPAPALPSPVAAVPSVDVAGTIGDWLKIKMTSASEQVTATGKAEMFIVDQSAVIGADTIKSFGANDLIVSNQKLSDGNNDGVVTFGKDDKLDFANGGSLSLGSTTSLRYLGETADGYVYGNAKVWSAGATLPTLQDGARFVSGAANETWIATNARETFFFDNAKLATGTDTIRGFGSDDVIVTSKAFVDGNKDGLIVAGNDIYGLGNGKAGIKLPDTSKAGLRFLGQTDEGFVYGDAAVRPKGALEGKLSAADTLTGGKADSATDKFFFDTALDRSMGANKITNFGQKDVIVTTEKLSAGAAGTIVTAANGLFAFGHEGLDLGSMAITGIGGVAVGALEFDGEKVVGGTHYFVYSAVGSAVGLDAIG